MTNTDTRDAAATLTQIRELAAAGCEIVRVAVPDRRALDALPDIVADSPVPVIADIHFNHRLALGALAAGVHGLRVNPGTIRSRAGLARIAEAAAERSVPVRVGVNAGSLEPDLLAASGTATPEAMVASALRHCAFFEERGCRHLKVSLKASSVPVTVAAYRLFAAQTDYPLHVGITEAGSVASGTVKSAVGIGALLLEGIGDTVRVSLTGPPREEVIVARRILEAAGLRAAEPEIVSCPTCGRTGIPVETLVAAVEREIDSLKAAGQRIRLKKVAIMGCVVNGPGEARDADVGVAGGKGKGVLFRHGEIVRSVPAAELLPCLLAEIRRNTEPAGRS
jgi:(E)-4-hydroxy-3-methylbut-2-enyl-diphosphate synthase